MRVGLKIAVKDEPIFFRKGGFSQKNGFFLSKAIFEAKYGI